MKAVFVCLLKLRLLDQLVFVSVVVECFMSIMVVVVLSLLWKVCVCCGTCLLLWNVLSVVLEGVVSVMEECLLLWKVFCLVGSVAFYVVEGVAFYVVKVLCFMLWKGLCLPL
jgi:hypothetical protein